MKGVCKQGFEVLSSADIKADALYGHQHISPAIYYSNRRGLGAGGSLPGARHIRCTASKTLIAAARPLRRE